MIVLRGITAEMISRAACTHCGHDSGAGGILFVPEALFEAGSAEAPEIGWAAFLADLTESLHRPIEPGSGRWYPPG